MQKLDKTLREVGEHGFSEMIQKYANSVRLPNETQEQAFVRVFTSADSEGESIRRAWRVSKGDDNPHDPLNEPDDEDDEDAMEQLERLAEQERRRSGTSKAIAFAKVYQDPANAKLAARERMQNRPR
jgi:hypothetical protein